MAENEKEALDLELFWDDLRVGGRRWSAETPEPEPEGPPPIYDVPPGTLVIGTSRHRILVAIKADGTIQYGPEYRPDEAAQVFWEAMAQRKLDAEDRILVIQHMEALLTRLGRQDMETERLRLAAIEEPDPLQKAALNQSAEMAIRHLEMIMHQVIEFSRGLVRRPEVVPPQMPPEVPRSIRENPDNQYTGLEGLPPVPPETPDRNN
jgi:hypothetical protein